MQTACCKLSDFNSQNSGSGQWCAPNTSCTISNGTHFSIDCRRTETTNSYGTTTPAANSNTIKCSVSGGNVTVSFGFKKTNGQSSGGAVNSGSSSTFSGIQAITSVSVSPHGSHYFSESYSPSLISNYNEYNAEVTVLNNNNESCSYSIASENNCYKFSGPEKCTFKPASQDAFAKIVCNTHSCQMSYGNISSANTAVVIPTITGTAKVFCIGTDSYGVYKKYYGPYDINIGNGWLDASTFCSGNLMSGYWEIMNCKLSNGTQTSYDSPKESCTAEYTMKNDQAERRVD